MKTVIILSLFIIGICNTQRSLAQQKKHSKTAWKEQAAKVIVLKDADNNKTIRAKKGDEISLQLSENRTTGYGWNIIAGAGNAQLLDDRYEVRAHATGMAGVGGIHTFHFKVLKTGKTEIVLIYSRSWEKNDKSARHYNIHILAK